MQKEKKIRTYTRKSKTGKTVTVKAHTAKYDAAEEARKAFAKKAGAGSELTKAKQEKAKSMVDDDLGFTAEDYKAWYHWDTEGDPKNASALKVKKALIAKMGRSAYNKYEKQMTDSYSARGHLKGFKGVGSELDTLYAKVAHTKPGVIKDQKLLDAAKKSRMKKRLAEKESKGYSKEYAMHNQAKAEKAGVPEKAYAQYTKLYVAMENAHDNGSERQDANAKKKLGAFLGSLPIEQRRALVTDSDFKFYQQGGFSATEKKLKSKATPKKESASTKSSTMTKEKAEKAFEKFVDKNDAILDRLYAAEKKYGKKSEQYKKLAEKQKAAQNAWQSTEEFKFLTSKKNRDPGPTQSFLRKAMGYSKEEAAAATKKSSHPYDQQRPHGVTGPMAPHKGKPTPTVGYVVPKKDTKYSIKKSGAAYTDQYGNVYEKVKDGYKFTGRRKTK